MHINNMVIEVTRRCQLRCSHCLRGETQQVDLSTGHIDALLRQVDSYGTITFTGGEPTLAMPVMKYFLKQAKKKGSCIGNFYIATNGIDIPTEFVLFCVEMYALCDEKDMCAVEVSNDYYHSVEAQYDTEMLDALKFFRRKFEKEQYDYNRDSGLINEGRAIEETGAHRKNTDLPLIKTREDLDEVELYMNVFGHIINGCDWSYESQPRYKQCNAVGLAEWIATLDEGEE